MISKYCFEYCSMLLSFELKKWIGYFQSYFNLNRLTYKYIFSIFSYMFSISRDKPMFSIIFKVEEKFQILETDRGFPNASLYSQNGEMGSLQAGKLSRRQPWSFLLARVRVPAIQSDTPFFVYRTNESLSSTRCTRTRYALARVSDGRSSRAAATWSVYDTLTVPVTPDARLRRYHQ